MRSYAIERKIFEKHKKQINQLMNCFVFSTVIADPTQETYFSFRDPVSEIEAEKRSATKRLPDFFIQSSRFTLSKSRFFSRKPETQ